MLARHQNTHPMPLPRHCPATVAALGATGQVAETGTVCATVGAKPTAGCRSAGQKARSRERNFAVLIIATGRSCRAAKTAAALEVGRDPKVA